MPAKKSVKKVVKKTVKKAAKKPIKKVVKKPVKKVVKKSIKKTVKKAAKKPIKKVVKKPVKQQAKKTVKKVVKKPAKKITEKATKKSIKKMAKKPTKATTKKVVKMAKTVKESKVKLVKVPVKKIKQKAGATFMGEVPYKAKKSEKHMSEPMKDHFRKILTKWKQELMEEVDRTMHHMQDESSNFPDPSDRATQEEEFNLELRARDRERKLIWKIDTALNALDDNTYGYCEACDEEIGLRRLEARPTAQLCIDCKVLDEIKEKQRQGG
jgi:DnaK suppressor protein